MTDFAVVNESKQPIEVRYKLKYFNPKNPFDSVYDPAKRVSSLLVFKEWQLLTNNEYQIDQENHTVIVPVASGEMLRIARIPDYRWRGANDPEDAKRFYIEKITITGEKSELKLMGEDARLAFVSQSRTLYTLTYK